MIINIIKFDTYYFDRVVKVRKEHLVSEVLLVQKV